MIISHAGWAFTGVLGGRCTSQMAKLSSASHIRPTHSMPEILASGSALKENASWINNATPPTHLSETNGGPRSLGGCPLVKVNCFTLPHPGHKPDLPLVQPEFWRIDDLLLIDLAWHNTSVGEGYDFLFPQPAFFEMG